MQTTLMQRGKFITFEGSEGCGKSTQIDRLVSALKERGIEVIQTREPGGTVVGEKIRHLLQFDREVEALSDESELLLFAASRAELVRKVIEPALEAGKWVIADRFMDSTTVYQGMGRGLSAESVEAINQLVVGDTVPDVTLLLDLDVETGMERARAATGGQWDRMEAQSLEFFEAVRAGYLAIADQHPDRISVIDASQSRDEVFAAIMACLETRVGGLET